jgi:hypothetical protein
MRGDHLVKIEVTVCDVGQEVGKPVTRYTIKRGGETIELDLCVDHGEPIETLVTTKSGAPKPTTRVAPAAKKAPPRAAKKASGSRRRSSSKVVSMADIEAMKKK